MGFLQVLTKSITTPPIAVHIDHEVIRLMQVRGRESPSLLQAFEVSRNDTQGLQEAIESFSGNRCVICVSSSDVLIQHIRVGHDATSDDIKRKLMEHHELWNEAEVRTICVATTGTGGLGNLKRELLCMGIDQATALNYVNVLESVGGRVEAVTVPAYASIRAFDNLYRRDGDENMTSMLIDFDKHASMIMIAHGNNCVFAHRLSVAPKVQEQEWKSNEVLKQITPKQEDEFERRVEQIPRGFCEVGKQQAPIDSQLRAELLKCIQHHDALFPQRAIDRIIFSGTSASDTDTCASIASSVGIAGFVADPTAWIDGAPESISGPAWTTASGTCLRFVELVA